MFKRPPARKLWIASVFEIPAPTPEEQTAETVRVNLIATVTEVFIREDRAYAAITIDDGSATIRAKLFTQEVPFAEKIAVGDVTLIVGRVKKYQQETYIAPDFVRKIDPQWLYVRKRELVTTIGQPPQLVVSSRAAREPLQEYEPEAAPLAHSLETSPSSFGEAPAMVFDSPPPAAPEPMSKKAQILGILRSSPNGSDLTTLGKAMNLSDAETEAIVTSLLEDGEIYMPQPGKLKAI